MLFLPTARGPWSGRELTRDVADSVSGIWLRKYEQEPQLTALGPRAMRSQAKESSLAD